MLGKFLVVLGVQSAVSRTPPWSWQSCQLNQPTGAQCSAGAVAGNNEHC